MGQTYQIDRQASSAQHRNAPQMGVLQRSQPVPLTKQDGFEYGEQRIGGTAAVVAPVARRRAKYGSMGAQSSIWSGLMVGEAGKMFFDVLEDIGVQKLLMNKTL